MTLEPLLQAPLAVQLHVATVIPAFLIGTWVMFFSRRGSKSHRILGVAFLALLTITSIIAIFIHRAAPNSPVFGFSTTHLTIPWTLALVWMAIDSIRVKKFMRHRLAVVGLYGGSLAVTALVNIFTSNHLLHQVFFLR